MKLLKTCNNCLNKKCNGFSYHCWKVSLKEYYRKKIGRPVFYWLIAKTKNENLRMIIDKVLL
jgi:hypothetical protein